MYKMFEGFTQPFPEEEPSQPPNSLFKFFLFYTRGFKLPIIIMSLLAVVEATSNIYLFNMVGEIVDWLNHSTPSDFWQTHKNGLIFYGVLLIVILPLSSLFFSLIIHQSILGNYPMSIRWLAHRYLLKQSLDFFHSDFAGRISTKVMQTALAIRSSTLNLMDALIYISVTFIGMFFLLIQANWKLTIPVVVWLILFVVIHVYFIPRLGLASSKQANARSVMSGRIVDSYTNISTVKLFSHSQRETAYVKRSMKEFLQAVYVQMRYITGFYVFIDVLNYILIFVLVGLSLYLWTFDAVTVGDIAVIIALSMRLQGLSQRVMWLMSDLFENVGTVMDGMKTISQPVKINDNKNNSLLVTEGCIQFKNLYFSYTDENDQVFRDLNLTIKPGEKVGLVGRSGSGKSTLVNLLLRFYEIDKGLIEIDGQSISDVTQDSLRGNIGLVTQDTSLLHRSIKDNIYYGNPEASEEALHLATKQAHANDFIQTLIDPYGNVGYDAQVGERGVKLSGGQRQRISIARVLLKNAPILILDEATSALDSEVEAAIQETMNQLMKNKTVIAIAHRLSTIAAMDRLIVLDKGKIVEQGTHQQLLDNKSIYAQLWMHQSGGFLNEGK